MPTKRTARPTRAQPEREWQPIGIDSRLERGPEGLPTVSLRGRLDVLPFKDLHWADFERLLWRVLRDVEGLRDPRIYGDAGQRQMGIDLVARDADGSGVALQSKQVNQFGPARIKAAVDAFRTTVRPFRVDRFIIGVSREVRTTTAIDRLRELQAELEPIVLELWDARELSRRLKGAPEIVIDFFGRQVAEAFCDPFTVLPRVVPHPDLVAMREALARTPEVTTGAGANIQQARELAAQDPAGALALVEKAQADLVDAGFAGHAAQHEDFRSSLLVAVGRGDEATRRRLDELWLALDQGTTSQVDIARRAISTVVAEVGTKAARDHLSVAERARALYLNPLATVPDLKDLLIGETLDRARLVALAGETALASGNREWPRKNATKIRNLAKEIPTGGTGETLAVRLRILAAEGSGTWAPVLKDARTLRLGHELGALVQARYARHLAYEQRFEEADASWDEAAGNACLAGRWSDASRWMFSRRAFRVRWSPFTSDDLLPVQTALSARGPNSTVLPRDEEALQNAFGRLAEERLRPAAIAAQRALRDAVTLSDWEGERRARRLLAEVLIRSGEHLLAAEHLVLAGDVKALQRLASDHQTGFLDVTRYLHATPWWVVGAAYRFVTAQADLVPDGSVPPIADRAIGVLESARAGTLVDLAAFGGSRFLGAVAVLAALSERLSHEQADTVLGYFEAQAPVEGNQYRYHDEDEATCVAGILTTHTEFVDRALPHLVDLMNRSDPSRTAATHKALVQHVDQARPHLERLAGEGSRWARDQLNSNYPDDVPSQQILEARTSLEEPLVHMPGVRTVGSGSRSVPDSILVRTLPVGDQQIALRELVERGGDPRVSAPDRRSYLLAASNLLPPESKDARADLLDKVLRLVFEPPPPPDSFVAPTHPLGAFRILEREDCRAEAVLLATALARTRADKERVRAVALGLVGDESVSEVWVTRALQRLGETMAPDVGFLSGQNWALRSFAALIWAKTTEPPPVGYRLALDPDVRVRRELATSLVQEIAQQPAAPDGPGPDSRPSSREALLDILRNDRCFSVRRLIPGGGDDPAG